jgi:uncharacterized protein involved in tolerance to divalent cations
VREKWKNSQPQGYLFWLNILKNENENQGMLKVTKEGLEALRQRLCSLQHLTLRIRKHWG